MKINKQISPSLYVHERTVKRHIVLHHTAGGTMQGALATWLKSGRQVGTHFIIDRDGTITQVVPVRNWIFSLGLNVMKWKHRREWERQAVSVELVAFGGLTEKDGKWTNWTGKAVPQSEVELVDFRGYKAYHAYTQAQIDSLGALMDYLCATLKISPSIDVQDFCGDKVEELAKIEPNQSKHNVFTHANFRGAREKQDCYPSRLLLDFLAGYKPSKKVKITGIV